MTAHDIAKTHSEIRAFKDALQILFVEGHVFTSREIRGNIPPRKVPAIGGYFKSTGVKPEFVTQSIETTLRRRVVFNCGTEQALLWGAPKAEDVKEIAERLKFVTAHVLDRVDAEFDHISNFAAFDVTAVQKAYGCADEAPANRLQQHLNRHVRRFARDLHVDELTAAQEYSQVARLIFTLTSPGRPLATKSNNAVWERMLRPDVTLSHLPQLKTMKALNVLSRFYLCIEDGECVVERDLGELLEIMAAHKNGSDELADDMVLAVTDPIKPTDICVGGLAVGSAATLGPKGIRWAALWRGVNGARMGCLSMSLRKVIKRQCKRPGTYVAAKANVLAAAEYAVVSEMERRESSGSQLEEDNDAVTTLGVRKSFFQSALGDKAKREYQNKGFDRFQKLTEAKKLRGRLAAEQKKRKVWEAKRAATPAVRLEHVSQLCFLGEIGERLPHPISESLKGVQELTGRKRTWSAHLVVVDDLTRLQTCPDEATVSHVLAIVGLGLPVVTSASWSLALGDPTKVPKESVIRHRPLAEKKFVF